MKEAIGFSSEGLADDDAFVRYRRLYAQGADVVRLDGPFRARVTGWRFRHMLLFDRHGVTTRKCILRTAGANEQ